MSITETCQQKEPAPMVMSIASTSAGGSSCDVKDRNKRRNQQQQQKQRIRAIIAMAISSSLHFAGFELARSATMALFTSSRTGFTSPSASPLSIVCLTPFSYLLLKQYTKSLQRRGPRQSLFYSTLAFAASIGLASLFIQLLEPNLQYGDDNDNDGGCNGRCTIIKLSLQAIIFLLHVCQSGFVQLLTTQHWSFLGSVCGKEDGAVMFAPISGIASITSTLAAVFVSPLVDRVGLSGLLWVAAVLLITSGVAADDAYRIAERYLEPIDGIAAGREQSGRGGKQQNSQKQQQPNSLLKTSHSLFERVPILASLCVEVLTCQCVSAIINFLFVLKLKESIQDDEQRARWMGTCYAWINASSGFLQFAVLPFLLRKQRGCSSRNDTGISTMLWLVMPCTMILCASLMTYQKETTLELVALSFAIFKVLEYSIRSVTLEMVFLPLDYESRFIGKEIIGLFVNRFGKSTMAVALFFAANMLESDVLSDKIFVQTLSVSSFLWFYVSYPLSQQQQMLKQKTK